MKRFIENQLALLVVTLFCVVLVAVVKFVSGMSWGDAATLFLFAMYVTEERNQIIKKIDQRRARPGEGA